MGVAERCRILGVKLEEEGVQASLARLDARVSRSISNRVNHVSIDKIFRLASSKRILSGMPCRTILTSKKASR